MDIERLNRFVNSKCASHVELLLADWHSWCHTTTRAFSEREKTTVWPLSFEQSNQKTAAQIVHYSIWNWPNCRWRLTVLFGLFLRYASLIHVIKHTDLQWNSIVEIVSNDFEWKNFRSYVCYWMCVSECFCACGMSCQVTYSLGTRRQVVSKAVIKLYSQARAL